MLSSWNVRLHDLNKYLGGCVCTLPSENLIFNFFASNWYVMSQRVRKLISLTYNVHEHEPADRPAQWWRMPWQSTILLFSTIIDDIPVNENLALHRQMHNTFNYLFMCTKSETIVLLEALLDLITYCNVWLMLTRFYFSI